MQIINRLKKKEFDTSSFSACDWWEYWQALQWIETPQCHLYDSHLQAYIGHRAMEKQDGFEPMCHLIEWAAADALGKFSSRLLKDDPRQILLAALNPITVIEACNKSEGFFCELKRSENFALQYLWKGSALHSLVMPKCASAIERFGDNLRITLADTVEWGRDDLIECSLYCNRSQETFLLVNGAKATAFFLGDTVAIHSANRKILLQFTLLEGEGRFAGQLLFANRPNQLDRNIYRAYDWKIALRTLSRSPRCVLQLSMTFLDGRAIDCEPHSMHAIVDVENSACNSRG